MSVPDPNTFGGPVRLRRAGEREWTEAPFTHAYDGQSRGIGILQSGERAGARFAYMDTEKTFGTVIEFFRREKRL